MVSNVLLLREARKFTDDLRRSAAEDSVLNWQPFPDSPQQQAYESEADVLGYGGAAGGGKTDLLLGLAFTQHQRSIIFRRHYTDLSGIVDRGNEIQDGRCTFVWGVKRRWETPDNRLVELGAVDYDKDKIKYRGRAHDFIGIDESADFAETIFRFVTAWLRTDDPDQRTRVVLTFNPPTTTEGEWIVKYFAPWLDPNHPKPAKPGELRYFARIDDEDVEVDADWRRVDPVSGDVTTPKSRTFIPARVEDNPHLMATDYIAQLEQLPEPLRSQLRYGDFTIGTEDDPWQCIPTAWILEAQERGRQGQRPNVAMRSAGVDVARGGRDNTVIQPLYGVWFDTPAVHPGETTPDGATVARLVTALVPGLTPIAIDVIGYGASAYDHLAALNNVKVTPVNNAGGSRETDKSGRYQFQNVRAASYWKLREALDPTSGENIALPPDRRVRVDLAAPRYRITGGRIGIEPKEDLIKRIGFSPDYGDAIVLAWWGAHDGTPDWGYASV